jgi:hypothetical protein
MSQPVNEISKGLAGRYIKAAKYKVDIKKGETTKQGSKRAKGIDRAVNRLTREEEENMSQVNEISKGLANRYADKATKDLSNSFQMSNRKFGNRVKGINKVAKKMIEDKEIIETKDLFQNVIDKKPAEFVSTFDTLMKNKISELVANKKLELSDALFGAPEGQETEEEDEPKDEPELPLEEPEVNKESWGQYKALDKKLSREKKEKEEKEESEKKKKK